MEEVGVAYTGSVLEHIPRVREAMMAALKESAPGVWVIEETVDSLDGALWRARGAR